MKFTIASIAIGLTLVVCDTKTKSTPAPPPPTLVINEAMSKNDGAWVDELGETDDWIELRNAGDTTLHLGDYEIGDAAGFHTPLPDYDLPPAFVILLWADDDVWQNALHLPFKLSSDGDEIFLWEKASGKIVDHVVLPATAPNDSFMRFDDDAAELVRCRWATPRRPNGKSCGPPPAPDLPDDVNFADYTWPAPWPEPPGGLVLTELLLRPATFIELQNTTSETIHLADYALRVAPQTPGVDWPGASDGVLLDWPATTDVAPGERVVVTVPSAAVDDIATDPDFEGVVSLWHVGGSTLADRIAFNAWPSGASLARFPDGSTHTAFCSVTSSGASNAACAPLTSRTIVNRLRDIQNEADFAALAQGDVSVTSESVKFIVDLDRGDVVHLLDGVTWDLHYTFVREEIDGDPHLDRCDPQDNQLFHAGWGQFSQDQYVEVEGRRYLLGTLTRYAGSDLHTVEFTTGDHISSAQMQHAFFTVMAHVYNPTDWALRPQSDLQALTMSEIEGNVPIVGQNTPFRDITYQPLTPALGYGVLTFVPAGELDSAPLGPQVIVVTDELPNDLPLVGGLITETFQTPLAHVAVLSRNRGTPDMALRDAREDPTLAPLFGSLIRLEVGPGGFTAEIADAAEAEAFWEAQHPAGEVQIPDADTSVRDLQPLSTCNLADLPAIGAKAAGLAELMRVDSTRPDCLGPVNTPEGAFAIPVVHYMEHFAASGAAALLETLEADDAFRTDPLVRHAGLAQLRDVILNYPIDAALLADIEGYIDANLGTVRLRFRSSSNTEDLPGFSGAGLYTSVSGDIDNEERRVDVAILTVWASLWNDRAYDERAYNNIQQDAAAMAVLVHPAFLSERMNGVAISRNILEPVRGDIFYINSQIGEASVTNPAPGITSEQLLYSIPRTPHMTYQAKSNLTGGEAVLSADQAKLLACTLAAIHTHFHPLVDPDDENPWFAMDTEFKFIGPDETLLVKQARPYVFGHADIPSDCREF